MAKRELQPDPRPARACLYNEHGSKVFEGEEAIEAALEDGWQDTPVELAQTPAQGDEDLERQVQELNQGLAVQHEIISAAKKDVTDLRAEVKAQTARADAAEAENKKLAAALKKAKADASK